MSEPYYQDEQVTLWHGDALVVLREMARQRGSDEGWDKSRLNNPGQVQKAQFASLREGRHTAFDRPYKSLLGTSSGPRPTACLRASPTGCLVATSTCSCSASGGATGSISAPSVPTQPFAAAHFACMPPALAERAILSGCKPGGTVLDPFSGSGTTGLAAAKHGRKYVGIDLSRDYLDLSLRTRLAQTALLDDGGAA